MSGDRTAHHCSYLGASLYASGFVIAFLPFWVSDLMLPYAERILTGRAALAILAGAIPPLALIGAGMGFRLYSRAIGEANARPVGCAETGYRFVFVGTLATLGLLLILAVSRESALRALLLAFTWLVLWYRRHRMAGGLALPVWALVLAIYAVAVNWGTHAPERGFLPCTLAALLAGDALLLDAICRWREHGRLAPAAAFTFQFSLRSLLALTLGIATYVSVLVLLIGS